MKFTTLSVIGLGYIGLPTAATFASRGLNVIGVDINQQTVDIINSGGIHIVEPDLDILVHSVVQTGNLRATLTPENADAFIVAVPTPFKDDKQPDLKYIEAACMAIASVLQKGNLVILESTSPVGATEQMAEWLAAARPDLTFPQQVGEVSDIRVAHCPERVLPGKVLEELIHNDRVVGGITPKCSAAAVELYKLFVQGDCVITNARAAEMCKLTENSFRDVNIAFANELSMICDKLDINVWELIRLANRHPRVNILQPGPGVGGHCIAVDPWFIVASASEEAKIIRTAREVNDHKPKWVIDKVEQEVKRFMDDNPNNKIQDVTVACFGLAFKPDIDDLRESPALNIVRTLAAKQQFKVIAAEPNITELEVVEIFELVETECALSNSDVQVLLVDHKSFRHIKNTCNYLIDTRGGWQLTLE
jgi:UDP-N-acetyl-D-mannosaminuronic acid dehydrogenase